MKKAEKILKDFDLRKTNFRIELVALFLNSTSLTADDIKEKISATKDKVTIYRALEAFEKKCMIHRVPDKDNLIRYAICQRNSSCSHDHNHAHFICNVCADTFCIESINTPIVKNEEGFNIKKSKLILEGECPSCQ